MYRGKRYYVSARELNCPPTLADSLTAANDWWQKKLVEIEGATVKPGSGKAIETIARSYATNALDSPLHLKATIEHLLDDLHANGQVELTDNDGRKHLATKDQVIDALLGENRAAQIRETAAIPPSVPDDHTIAQQVANWVNMERQRVITCKVGPERADSNRRSLVHFQDFLGKSASVESITEEKWLAWYGYLSAAVKAGKWNIAHVNRIFAVSKRFVRFLWELRLLLTLPRNLDSKNLAFPIRPRQVQIFEDEEIARLYAVVRNQSRLHFLLMLNCGMLARDISDLRQDQVDWKNGIITRKRSKTQDHPAVPVVRYKLWGQTWEELKKWRSTDAEIVLLTHTGKRWIEAHEGETGFNRSDKVRSAFRVYLAKGGVKKPSKMLRATGASKLAEHPQYKYFSQYYLGHSPRTVAEKHYVRPTDKEFFEALAWLEGALGLR